MARLVGYWTGGSRVAVVVAIVLAVPPALPTATTQPAAQQDAWPPLAWEEGRIGDLSLLEQILILHGERPGTSTARGVEAQLADLDRMDPDHAVLARQAVAALAQAAWHQQKALEGLNPQQRAQLAAAALGRPAPGLDEAVARIDRAEVARALAALLAGSDGIAATLAERQRGPATAGPLQQALLPFLGETAVGPIRADPAPRALASLAARLAGTPDDPALAAAFEGLPERVRSGVGGILRAAVDLKEGQGDPSAATLRLAAAVDAARPALLSWRALTLAHQLAGRPDIQVPDPSSDLPPLGWGTFDWTSRPVEAVPLPQAVRSVAAALAPGLEDEAERQASVLAASLPQPQLDALARFFHALHLHIEAQVRPIEVPDPARLSEWDAAWQAGQVPASGSGAEQELLEGLPGLEAAGDAEAAADALWDAAAGLVPAFTPQQQQAAGVSPPACVPTFQLLFLLALDTCGGTDEWSKDALLLLDVGGDDGYTARLGAPFGYDPNAPGELPVTPASPYPTFSIPFSFTLDLGGSDAYRTAQDCAQGAACPDLAPSQGLDPTGLARQAPSSALIDWDGDGAVATNRFQAGARSQGFYAPTTKVNSLWNDGSALQDRSRNEASRALLVERAGDGSTLASFYEAGARSQGSAVNDGKAGTRYSGGSGLLLRTVGNASTATAVFQAGEASQGAASQGEVSRAWHALGAFVNVAGAGASSTDHYEAGSFSQAAIDVRNADNTLPKDASLAQAVFLDVAGPGGLGDDTYVAGDNSRSSVRFLTNSGNSIGWHRALYTLFVDAALPRGLPTPSSLLATEGDGTIPGTVLVDPSLEAAPVSSDSYRGGIRYDVTTQPPMGNGYGWRSPLVLVPGTNFSPRLRPTLDAGFYDLMGEDDYGLHVSWQGAAPDERPEDGSDWPGGQDLDVSDTDQDGHVGGLETLWSSVWRADSTDAGTSPAPLRSHIVLDQAKDIELDGPWALVLTLGAKQDSYLASYSAALHLDVGGDDVLRGRPGAAGGLFSDLLPSAGPPLAQHGLSLHIDLAGDDTYDSEHPRTQGYGEGGGVGLLFDLAGSDTYVAPSHAQGVVGRARSGTQELDTAALSAGAGILVDLGAPTTGESNWFQADEEPRQGQREGLGGLALLVATGDHNTLPDFPAGAGAGGGTVNLGLDNGPPEILQTRILGPDGDEATPASLRVGEEYRFEARVQDAHGDPVRACFTFQHGDPAAPASGEQCSLVLEGTDSADGAWVGTSFRWDEEHPVPTDAQDDLQSLRVPYQVDVQASDAGGKEATGHVLDVAVANPPPRFLASIPEATLRQDALRAYQATVLEEADTAAAAIEVNWGDGSPPDVLSGDGVDWASWKWGGRVRVPEAVPIVQDGTGRTAGVQVGVEPLTNAIDGDEETWATLQFNPASFPALHLFAEFEGARSIGRVVLDVDPAVPFVLSIEGIAPDGSPVPLAQRTLDGVPTRLDITLPERQVLTGVGFRQLKPLEGPFLGGKLEVNALEAWGPGATHAWTTPGSFDLRYTARDAYGGRNTTSARVTVLPAAVAGYDEKAGDIRDLPLRLVDAFGAGLARHVTVGASPTEADPRGGDEADSTPAAGLQRDSRLLDLQLRSLSDEGETKPCSLPQGQRVCLLIDWGEDADGDGMNDKWRGSLPGEGKDVQDGNGNLPSHRFTTVGVHKVQAAIERPSGTTPFSTIAFVHAERAFDLRVGGDPFLFIGLDSREQAPDLPDEAPGSPDLLRWSDRSWHTAGHRAIIDAAGDDAYAGAVAAGRPIRSSQAIDQLRDSNLRDGIAPLLPSLVVDAGGDDDYLSTVPGAQGFGTLAAAALLVDLGGDDRYVLPATDLHACLAPPPGQPVPACGGQGAGTRGGAGALLDFGGDDAWNPMLPEHPVVQDGLPDLLAPWASTGQARPPAFRQGTVSVGPDRPGLVQGAGHDGLGLFIAAGGSDTLLAGDLAQGFGGHDRRAQDLVDYTLPGLQDCDLQGATQGSAPQPASLLGYGECVLGVKLTTLDVALAAVDGTISGLPGTVQGLSPAAGAALQPVFAPLQGLKFKPSGPRFCQGLLAPGSGICLPDTRQLQGWLQTGPRFGPSLGVAALGGAHALEGAQQVQGSASGGGRGVLFDSGGALASFAQAQAQAFAADAHSLFFVGGPHRAVLGGQGQGRAESGLQPNPEALPQPLPALPPQAVYAGFGDDRACGEPASCGSFQPLPGAGLAPRTGVAWQDPAKVTGGDDTYTSDPGLALQADSLQAGHTLQGVLLATVHDLDAPEKGSCSGRRMAGPFILAAATSSTTTLPFAIDPAAAGPSGPLLPAGCVELRPYVRQVAPSGIPATGWSEPDAAQRGWFWWLPPPSVHLPDGGVDVLRIPGGQATLTVVADEPLAAAGSPLRVAQVGLRVLDGQGADAKDLKVEEEGPWRAIVGPEGTRAERDYALTFDPQGGTDFRVLATTSWSGTTRTASTQVGSLLVDASPPVVTLDAPLRKSWRGSETILLRGTVEDPAGVASLEFRLVEDTAACRVPAPPPACVVKAYAPHHTYDIACRDRLDDPLLCVIETVPPFQLQREPCPPLSCRTWPAILPPFPVGQASVPAALQARDPERTSFAFEAPILQAAKYADGSDRIFPGGNVTVQARASERGASIPGPWQALAGAVASPRPAPVLIDRAAPQAQGVQVGAAAGATSAVHTAGQPIPLTVLLRDCALDPASGLCGPGSGIAHPNVNVIVRDAASNTVVLPAQQAARTADGSYRVVVPWNRPAHAPTEAELPAEGAYELIVQARDNATNLLSQAPGVILTVDRTGPLLPPLERAFAIPPGQTALRPGNEVAVLVAARDAPPQAGLAPSGILRVEASILGTTPKPLEHVGNGLYAGTVTVPSVQASTAAVRVTALDRALNPTVAFSREFPFHRLAPEVKLESDRLRADSFEATLRAERPVQVVAANLTGPDGVVAGEVLVQGEKVHVAFTGLAEGTFYQLDLRVRDAAGHVVSLADRFGRIETLAKVEAALALLPLPAPDKPVSGPFEVAVRITHPLRSRLTLEAGGAVLERELRPAAGGPDPLVERFTLDTTHIAASLDGAVLVPLRATMDDGASLWESSGVLPVDNHAPEVDPLVLGPAPVGGWRNATVPVLANARDDTSPLAVEAWLDGAALGLRDRVAVSEEGRHRLAFRASDGATPPNRAPVAEVEFAIDRTPPTLHAFEAPAWHGPAATLPLQFAASDPALPDGPGAGVAGFRFRFGAPAAWSDWQPQAPAALAVAGLPEGRHALDVQVRDAAGNARTASRGLVIDRTPPALLALQWIGTTAQQPVLQFVARDGNASTEGSGLAAVQWLRGDGTEGTWAEAQAVGTLADVPADAVALRLRDRAGNVGQAALPSLRSVPVEAPPGSSEPSSDLLRSPLLAPQHGPAGQPFTFSVVVRPWQGRAPDGVALLLGPQRHALSPTGPELDGGGRLYSAQVLLEPTRLNAPTSFRFEATYGAHTVLSQPLDGPLVAAHAAAGAAQGTQAAILPLHLILAALVAAAGLSRRRTNA